MFRSLSDFDQASITNTIDEPVVGGTDPELTCAATHTYADGDFQWEWQKGGQTQTETTDTLTVTSGSAGTTNSGDYTCRAKTVSTVSPAKQGAWSEATTLTFACELLLSSFLYLCCLHGKKAVPLSSVLPSV